MQISYLSAGELMTARVVIKANAEATISVFLSARVRALPFRAGQFFRKGDVLINFDCSRYVAELNGRKAALKARVLEARNNKRLLKHQAIGASAVAVSIANTQEARAAVDAQQALVSQCAVKAPYDGKVVERLIHEHETPSANQPLIKIVDRSMPQMELIVPSGWLVWLKAGTGFDLHIDEMGKTYRARVKRMGAVVDAVSQTIKITGEFTGSENSVLPGMSGTATFSYSGS
jgi:RND family efflux transporter MFP subunit